MSWPGAASSRAACCMSVAPTVFRPLNCCASLESVSANYRRVFLLRSDYLEGRGQMKEPIKKTRLKDGTVRYRLVVDIGSDENGRRKQLTRTFDTRRDAREELSRVRHETNSGTYVRSSRETVNAYLDGYLKGATRDLRASTKRNYEDALWPVRERLGTRPLQSITKSDVEDLVDWILTAGRRRGGKPGT